MKDTRYGKIKIIILAALAALALVYFNYIRPVFEERASEARMTVLVQERDAEVIATIKSAPKDFEERVKADEAEMDDYEKRTGLLPASVAKNLSDKTPADAGAGAETDIAPPAGTGAEADTAPPAGMDAETDIAGKAATAGITSGGITIVPDAAGPKPVAHADIDKANAVPPYAGFEDSLTAQGYTVTMRAGYDAGVALMRAFEQEDAGSWSVGNFVYTAEGGGTWTIELTLYYTTPEG
jgi:hypothetical protein